MHQNDATNEKDACKAQNARQNRISKLVRKIKQFFYCDTLNVKRVTEIRLVSGHSMKESILLVDDQSVFNFISTKVIEGLGVSDEIHSALSGDDALRLINDYLSRSKSLPRLILIDINMPIMDGFAFIHAFGRLNIVNKEKTLLAILTSSVDQFDRDRALSLGIEYFLTKPLSEVDLKKVLLAAGVTFRT